MPFENLHYREAQAEAEEVVSKILGVLGDTPKTPDQLAKSITHLMLAICARLTYCEGAAGRELCKISDLTEMLADMVTKMRQAAIASNAFAKSQALTEDEAQALIDSRREMKH